MDLNSNGTLFKSCIHFSSPRHNLFLKKYGSIFLIHELTLFGRHHSLQAKANFIYIVFNFSLQAMNNFLILRLRWNYRASFLLLFLCWLHLLSPWFYYSALTENRHLSLLESIIKVNHLFNKSEISAQEKATFPRNVYLLPAGVDPACRLLSFAKEDFWLEGYLWCQSYSNAKSLLTIYRPTHATRD